METLATDVNASGVWPFVNKILYYPSEQNLPAPEPPRGKLLEGQQVRSSESSGSSLITQGHVLPHPHHATTVTRRCLSRGVSRELDKRKIASEGDVLH